MTDKRMLAMLRMIMDTHRKDNKIGMIFTDNDCTITYFIHYPKKK